MKDHVECRHEHFCDLIDRIYEAHDLKHIATTVLHGLAHLLPLTGAMFWPIDRATLEIQRGYRRDGPRGEMEPAEPDSAALEPMVARISNRLRLNDAVQLSGDPELGAAPAFTCRDEVKFRSVSVLGGWCEQPFAAIQLYRDPSAAEFSGYELSLVNRLTPHVARAMYLGALARNPSIDRNTGLLVLDREKRLIVRIGHLVHHLAEEALEAVLAAVAAGQMCVDTAPGWLRLAVHPVTPTSLFAARAMHPGTHADTAHAKAGEDSRAVIVSVSPFKQRRALKARLRRSGLSDREVQVAAGVMAGQTNARIAQQLFIDEKTVKDHLRRIYEKNRVHSRSALTAKILGLDFTLRDPPPNPKI